MPQETEAIHEAGHIITSLAAGLTVARASIDPAITPAGTAGSVWLLPADYATFPLRDFSSVTLHELRSSPLPKLDGEVLSDATCTFIYANVVSLMAGLESERLFSDRTPIAARSSSDMQKSMLYAIVVSGSPKAFMDCARADAVRILHARKHQVEALATVLLERKTLDAAEIREIVSEGVTPALSAERARRKQWMAMTASAELFNKMSDGGLVKKV